MYTRSNRLNPPDLPSIDAEQHTHASKDFNRKCKEIRSLVRHQTLSLLTLMHWSRSSICYLLVIFQAHWWQVWNTYIATVDQSTSRLTILGYPSAYLWQKEFRQDEQAFDRAALRRLCSCLKMCSFWDGYLEQALFSHCIQLTQRSLCSQGYLSFHPCSLKQPSPPCLLCHYQSDWVHPAPNTELFQSMSGTLHMVEQAFSKGLHSGLEWLLKRDLLSSMYAWCRLKMMTTTTITTNTTTIRTKFWALDSKTQMGCNGNNLICIPFIFWDKLRNSPNMGYYRPTFIE